jgi:hypothetical protein
MQMRRSGFLAEERGRMVSISSTQSTHSGGFNLPSLRLNDPRGRDPAAVPQKRSFDSNNLVSFVYRALNTVGRVLLAD